MPVPYPFDLIPRKGNIETAKKRVIKNEEKYKDDHLKRCHWCLICLGEMLLSKRRQL
jgi:hypothetical protein